MSPTVTSILFFLWGISLSLCLNASIEAAPNRSINQWTIFSARLLQSPPGANEKDISIAGSFYLTRTKKQCGRHGDACQYNPMSNYHVFCSHDLKGPMDPKGWRDCESFYDVPEGDEDISASLKDRLKWRLVDFTPGKKPQPFETLTYQIVNAIRTEVLNGPRDEFEPSVKAVSAFFKLNGNQTTCSGAWEYDGRMCMLQKKDSGREEDKYENNIAFTAPVTEKVLSLEEFNKQFWKLL